MKFATFASALALATTGVLSAGHAEARDQIRIVGSSTVYPFTTTVAEQFGKTSGMKTPVVESTGTGGGMKLFCAGVGEGHPDATNASRAMKKNEFDDCQKNGVKDIVEIKIGFDGLTLTQSKQGTPMKLTLRPAVPGAGEGSSRPGRQARFQPLQELVGHRSHAAEHQDRGARAAAHLRHARFAARAVHGGGRRADTRYAGTQEVGPQGVRKGMEVDP